MNFTYTDTFTRRRDLDEESQTQKITMAYGVKTPDGYTNKTPFFHCRDFINDVTWMDKTGILFSVYGLTYDPTVMPDTSPQLTLILCLPTDEWKHLQENLHYLHKLESYYKIHKTRLTELTSTLQTDEYNCNSSYTFVLLKASNMWKSHTIALSLYTALIRAFTYKLNVTTNIWRAISSLKTQDGAEARDSYLLYYLYCNTTHLTKFFNMVVHLKDLCLTANLSKSIPPNFDVQGQRYLLHNSLGFYTSIVTKGITSYMNTRLTKIKNKKGTPCLDDVKDVMPF